MQQSRDMNIESLEKQRKEFRISMQQIYQNIIQKCLLSSENY